MLFTQNLLAFFPGPETLGVMIPIIAIVGGLTIGLVNSLQAHQRKMAEIIHGSKNREELQAEIDSLRRDVSQLQASVSSQALALDGLANRKQLTSASEADSLSQRLG